MMWFLLVVTESSPNRRVVAGGSQLLAQLRQVRMGTRQGPTDLNPAASGRGRCARRVPTSRLCSRAVLVVADTIVVVVAGIAVVAITRIGRRRLAQIGKIPGVRSGRLLLDNSAA